MTAIRRLTAILAADVAGYSQLMGANEEARSNVSKRRGASSSIRKSPSTGAASPGRARGPTPPATAR